jgi:hypothetical protein
MSILQDYKHELEYAIRDKANGNLHISAGQAGPKLANGRDLIPIDEYIQMWQDGITAMEAGADEELYNY